MTFDDKAPILQGTNEEIVLQYAKEHESFNRAEIDVLLNTSPATSNRILKKLVGAKKLSERGNGKALRYTAN